MVHYPLNSPEQALQEGFVVVTVARVIGGCDSFRDLGGLGPPGGCDWILKQWLAQRDSLCVGAGGDMPGPPPPSAGLPEEGAPWAPAGPFIVLPCTPMQSSLAA